MSPDPTAPRGRGLPAWLGGAAVLGVATALGLLTTQLLVRPSGSDMRALALYFAVTGLVTMVVGWLALGVAERASVLSIRSRVFVSTSIGAVVALLNVLIVARLMFVSTAHDLRLLAALVVFGAVVTIGFSLWTAGALTARVRAITDAIRALSAGNYEGRLLVGGGDETARLAADVDALADRLQSAAAERDRLDLERRELTAAISHDLRTPLASVRAMIEALADDVISDPTEVRRYLEASRREIERLNRMIDDLFDLARLDAGALTLELQPLALQEVAAEVVEAMRAQAAQAGVTLELRAELDTPLVRIDGARIERVVGNLVRNALEHTPPGGRVEVSVRAAPRGAVVLAVSDTGEGIPTAELSRVWERFYRGEKSRHRPAGGADGAGLGLSIVRALVEAHGGAVSARTNEGAGVTFECVLPAGAPAA